jgi:hypothetical protein
MFAGLDVAIGLVFLYIVLALVCSTINEAIATVVGLRARFLQWGLLNLLSASGTPTAAGVETAKEFYGHPLVQGLIRPGRGPDPSLDPTSAPPIWRLWRRPPYPSYLPSRTFVAALADIAEEAQTRLAAVDEQETEEEVKAARARMADAAEGLERTLAALPNVQLSEAMLALYRSAGGDAARFQHAAEQWFDDAMERVSGWYKRRVQLWLFVIALVVASLLNADTLMAGKVLWRDDAVRAAVVRQAETAAEGPLAEAEIDTIVRNLQLPLGWDLSLGDAPRQLPDSFAGWLTKLAGVLLTVGAVMLGAPFWFDVLSKVVRVRTTGAPPPASDSVRSGEAAPSRAGPPVRPPGETSPGDDG